MTLAWTGGYDSKSNEDQQTAGNYAEKCYCQMTTSRGLHGT